MRKKKNGAARLIGAMWRRSKDPDFMQRLADMLNYMPEQLADDIDALHNAAEILCTDIFDLPEIDIDDLPVIEDGETLELIKSGNADMLLIL